MPYISSPIGQRIWDLAGNRRHGCAMRIDYTDAILSDDVLEDDNYVMAVYWFGAPDNIWCRDPGDKLDVYASFQTHFTLARTLLVAVSRIENGLNKPASIQVHRLSNALRGQWSEPTSIASYDRRKLASGEIFEIEIHGTLAPTDFPLIDEPASMNDPSLPELTWIGHPLLTYCTA